jgi:hypothetical protein
MNTVLRTHVEAQRKVRAFLRERSPTAVRSYAQVVT